MNQPIHRLPVREALRWNGAGLTDGEIQVSSHEPASLKTGCIADSRSRGRWQAIRWLRANSCTGGTSTSQVPTILYAQRVEKRHPGGGCDADGISPDSNTRARLMKR